MGVALVVTEYFENRFLSFSTSYIPATIVIIYILNVTNSLGNCILINIYYKPILRLLRGEIF